jgi:bifunctional non-homologous end joining protein LigD
MLAKEVREPFSDEHWLYEVKWDGYRAIAELQKDNVRMYSRSGQSFNDDYPELIRALQDLQLNAVLDGEIIALDPEGKSNLRLLEQYRELPALTLRFQVFDLLYKDDHCLEDQPLLWRKQLLKAILRNGEHIRYSDHVRGNGIGFFRDALGSAQEGIMGKRADSVYSEGHRSPDWLKIKTHQDAEAIIVGYMADSATLLLGRYQGAVLCNAGRVHKGLTPRWIDTLETKIKPLVRKTSPIKGLSADGPVTWLKPTLVCTIRYTEISAEGAFKHPMFRGLRTDKSAREVREND